MHKIALIEAGAFHDECLHSQIQYLKNDDVEVTLFCHPDLEKRVEDLPDVKEIIYFDLSTKRKKYLSWYRCFRHIVRKKFSKVIFNSAESNIRKLISFPFPKRIELIGTIHNAHHLAGKKKQGKVTKRIDNYLTLNSFITENIQKENLTKKKIGTYYPIVFPEYATSIKKPKNEIWITVPGVIAFDKRDYGIFENWKLPSHVKIIFLGRANRTDAKDFLETSKSYPSYNNFRFFDDFISNALFHDYIKNSDYIMPLVHPNNEFFDRFLKYKVTGSYNLAFGYKIPLLIEESFSEISDFKENAIFYKRAEIHEIFSLIEKNNKEFYQNRKWTFQFQKENYQNFIFDL